MKKIKKLSSVKVLTTLEQRNIKGKDGWVWGCDKPRHFFCEPGICVPWGTNCP